MSFLLKHCWNVALEISNNCEPAYSKNYDINNGFLIFGLISTWDWGWRWRWSIFRLSASSSASTWTHNFSSSWTQDSDSFRTHNSHFFFHYLDLSQIFLCLYHDLCLYPVQISLACYCFLNCCCQIRTLPLNSLPLHPLPRPHFPLQFIGVQQKEKPIKMASVK